MSQPADRGHPESQEDLDRIRRRNNERRREQPDLPASVGTSDHGVVPDAGGSADRGKASGSFDSRQEGEPGAP